MFTLYVDHKKPKTDEPSMRSVHGTRSTRLSTTATAQSRFRVCCHQDDIIAWATHHKHMIWMGVCYTKSILSCRYHIKSPGREWMANGHVHLEITQFTCNLNGDRHGASCLRKTSEETLESNQTVSRVSLIQIRETHNGWPENPFIYIPESPRKKKLNKPFSTSASSTLWFWKRFLDSWQLISPSLSSNGSCLMRDTRNWAQPSPRGL